MPEETVITDPKDEKEKPLGVEVREKSFQQILKEQQEARNKPADPVETPEEKAAKEKAEVEKKANEDAAAADKQAADKKAEDDRQAALASKAAEEVVAKQEAEKQKVLDAAKAEEAEKKRQETLKPAWQTDPNAPKDKDGNPIPRSYDEIAAETKRIAKEEIMAELEAKERAKTAKEAEDAAAKTKNDEAIKAQQTAAQEQLQKEMDEDIKGIYAAGDLPKIKDPKDENDPGNKEVRHLFETAQKVNAERMAAGKPLIRSVSLIRYGKDETGKPYYTPLTKKADVPILGNDPTAGQEAPEDKYVPARDRGKSMKQLIKEEADRMAKKLNIRSR